MHLGLAAEAAATLFAKLRDGARVSSIWGGAEGLRGKKVGRTRDPFLACFSSSIT